ncbi:MAG: hypothetical protein EOP04_28490 [Proteobacteria bacterium]|nr:MAG: hypothetical protein EOP04_28490 [Pseudomonadota bacterium]
MAVYYLEDRMYLLSASVSLILQNSVSAPYMLRKLYEVFKSHDKKYSMQYFCRKIGIASKGNFSDILAGKRPIAEHYWAKLCCAFKLTEPQAETFFEVLKNAKRSNNAK